MRACGRLTFAIRQSDDEILDSETISPSLSNGFLEDVVLEAVQNDPVIPCIDGFLECLRQPTLTFPTNESKARIQVYLAAKGSDYRLGLSASSGYWSYDHSAFAEVIGFIRNIAQIE